MDNFWLNEVIKVVVFFATAFGLGLGLGRWLVQNGVRVNYTRKIFHFVFFFFPIYLSSKIPYESSIQSTLVSGGVLLCCLLAMCKPIRERSTFIATAYSTIDRPEDRPFTLVWASSQL